MADKIYGIDRGDQERDITTGSTSPTKDVEVVIDLAVGLNKTEVLIALDKIKNHIIAQDDF